MITFYTDDKKYRTTNDNGRVTIARHGEPWRDETGDGYLLSLVHEVETLRDALDAMLTMHCAMMEKTNHGASFYDADCIRQMNEAPLVAQAALKALALTKEGE